MRKWNDSEIYNRWRIEFVPLEMFQQLYLQISFVALLMYKYLPSPKNMIVSICELHCWIYEVSKDDYRALDVWLIDE